MSEEIINNTDLDMEISENRKELSKHRVIFLHGDIDRKMSQYVITNLLLMKLQDPYRGVEIIINSQGGDIIETFAIYDCMRMVEDEDFTIRTSCIGEACSGAAFILAAGTQGLRSASPNSEIMIHQPSASAQGQITDMEIQLRNLKKMKRKFIELTALHLCQPMKVIRTMMERDKFMTPDEAHELGIIDSIR